MSKWLVIVALATIATIVSCEIAVDDVSPTWTHAFTGQDRIEVCGCNFHQKKSVICIWNSQFTSANAYIASDRTIYCEAPVFPASFFAVDGGPQNWRLDLIFDDGERYNVGDVRVGPQLNEFSEQLSSNHGRTAGGNTISIFGTGFADVWDGQPTIWFDGVSTNGTIVSDTEIQVTVPKGRINQNARLSVSFPKSGNPFYLHVDETYRYGPIVTGIEADCINPLGGDTITITGENFDDVVGAPNGVRPWIVVTEAENTWQEVVLGTVTASSITFTAPNATHLWFLEDGGSDYYSQAWGTQVHVDVYFKETWSQSVAEIGQYAATFGSDALWYQYGGYVLYSNGVQYARNQNGPYTRASTTGDSFFHTGGEDQMCVQFCGANYINFNSATTGHAFFDFFFEDYSGSNTNPCDDDSDPVVVSPGSRVSHVCCETRKFDDICGTASLRVRLTLPDIDGNLQQGNGNQKVGEDLANTLEDKPWGCDDGADGDECFDYYTYGPVNTVDSTSNRQLYVIPTQGRTLTFPNFHAARYQFDNSEVWTERNANYDGVVSGEDETVTCVNTACDEFTITSDTSISVTPDDNSFGANNEVGFEFDDGTRSETCFSFYVHWGPICGPFYMDKDLGKPFSNDDILDGLGLSTHFVSYNEQTTVTITGLGLTDEPSGTSTQPVFCERGQIDDDNLQGLTGSSRFPDNNTPQDSCHVFQKSTASAPTSATLPANTDKQILWGDRYDVFIYYRNTATGYVTSSYTSTYTTPLDITPTVSDDDDYNARFLCGRVRVGCVADDNSCSSPFGPSANFYLNDAAGSSVANAAIANTNNPGSITVDGQYLTTGSRNSQIALVGYTTSASVSGGASSFTAGVSWNKEAQHGSLVDTICDVCNLTRPEDAVPIAFGPIITRLWVENNDPLDEEDYDWYTADQYGLNCMPDWDSDDDEGSDLYIYGFRFSDYVTGCMNADPTDADCDKFDDTEDRYDGEDLDITVFVDGVQAEIYWLYVPEDSAEEEYLQVEAPVRPFGTRGEVRVYFGKQCNGEPLYTEDDDDLDNYYSNWKHYLVAKQSVVYAPAFIKHTSITAVDTAAAGVFGYYASITGLQSVTFAMRGLNYPYNEAPVSCYFDNYIVQGVAGENEVTCHFEIVGDKKRDIITDEKEGLPRLADGFNYKFGAEFNTLVGVHLEWDIEVVQVLPQVSYGDFENNTNNFYYNKNDEFGEISNELSTHDVKVWYDEKWHWGPVCSGAYSFDYSDDESDSALINLAGSYLVDCLAADNRLGGNTDDLGDSDDFTHPHTPGQSLNGNTYCQQRRVTLNFYWEDVGGRLWKWVIFNNADGLDVDSTGGGYDFFNENVPNPTPNNIVEFSRPASGGSEIADFNDLPCPFVGSYEILYLDAIVTNGAPQYTIECEDEVYIYGPSITNVAVVQGSATGAPNEPGWIGTVTTFHAFAAGLNEIDVTFDDLTLDEVDLGSNVICLLKQGTSTAFTFDAEVSGDVVTCQLPTGVNSHYGTTYDLYIEFRSADVDEIACDYEVCEVTIGPKVVDAGYCEDPELFLSSDGQLIASITFHVYGAKCCGFDDTSAAVVVAAGYSNANSVNTWTGCSQGNCDITFASPGGPLAPDGRRINGFKPSSTLGPINVAFFDEGVSGGVVGKTSCDGSVYCPSATFEGTQNQLCFGPWFEPRTQDVRYTYAAQASEATDEDNGDHVVQKFYGVFDFDTEYDPDTDVGSEATFVDFCIGGNTNCQADFWDTDDIDEFVVTSGDTLDIDLWVAMYDLQTPSIFQVECKDPSNVVKYRFRQNSVTFTPRDTYPEVTTFANTASFRDTTGNELTVTLDHRPRILDWYAASRGRVNIYGDTDGSQPNVTAGVVIRSSEYGNLQVTVTLNNAYDFYQSDEEFSFGYPRLVGLLGNKEGTHFVSHAFLADVHGTTIDYAQAGTDDFIQLFESDPGSNPELTFTIPPGEFNSKLYLHFLWNPHIDSFTHSNNGESDEDYESNYFYWEPYLTRLSKTWILPRGHESFGVWGQGFCGSVQTGGEAPEVTLALTDSAFAETGPELYSSCVVHKDTLVTCMTPAVGSIGSKGVSLTFRGDCEDTDCGEQYVVSGLSVDSVGFDYARGVAPDQVSNQGGTKVYIPFYGGEHFSAEGESTTVNCRFKSKTASVDNDVLFDAVFDDSARAFYCVIPKLINYDGFGAEVDINYYIDNLELVIRRPTTPEPNCVGSTQNFVMITDYDAVTVGFPCTTALSYKGEAFANYRNIHDLRHDIEDASMAIRGNFFPTEVQNLDDLQIYVRMFKTSSYVRYLNDQSLEASSDEDNNVAVRYLKVDEITSETDPATGLPVNIYYNFTWPSYNVAGGDGGDDDEGPSFGVDIVQFVLLVNDSSVQSTDCSAFLINSAASMVASIVLLAVSMLFVLF